MKDVIFSWKKYLIEQTDTAKTMVSSITGSAAEELKPTEQEVKDQAMSTIAASVENSFHDALAVANRVGVDKSQLKAKLKAEIDQIIKENSYQAIQNVQIEATQLQSTLSEEKKKKGDRCTRIAKRKYKVWPSAYASGAVVKCRQGKIWKGISEDMSDEEIDRALLLEVKIVGSQQIDKTAGVWDTNEQFNDGTDFKIKFKVSDVIELAKQKPVKEVNPKDINYNFSGRIEDDKETESRVTSADLSYPILVVQNRDNKIFALLDGTHRLEKALRLKLDKIKVKIFDIDELEQFKTDKLEEKWSQKYKRSIDCKNPKGFSQKAHCQGRKKK